MTAEDIKFTFDTILNPNVDAADQRSYLTEVESYEVLDKYTFRAIYGKQYWYARNVLGGQEVLPKKLYDPDDLQKRDPKAFGKRFNESPLNRKPVGTGPYKFVRWDTGQQMILDRNDDYWNKQHAGHLDRIIYRFITDDVAALQALKNGEIDFNTRRIKPESFDGEMNEPAMKARFAKVSYDIGGYLWVGWNARRPPFDDVRVRQAMEFVVDQRQKIVHRGFIAASDLSQKACDLARPCH